MIKFLLQVGDYDRRSFTFHQKEEFTLTGDEEVELNEIMVDAQIYGHRAVLIMDTPTSRFTLAVFDYKFTRTKAGLERGSWRVVDTENL
jgi:hypothetical protein